MAENQSLWRETVRLPGFGPLRADLKTDVLVVGGGLAGILCAHMLRSAGVDCALAEAGTLCSGTTGNTTAKLTVQHGLIYASLIRTLGPERAQMYLRANQQALDAWRGLCAGMDCDFEPKDSFVYSTDDRPKLERELTALRRLGVPARLAEGLPLPVATVGAVCVPDQAQFNPLKFAAAMAKGLPIYENTPVLELAPGLARTPGGFIRAEKIVVATHFPMLNKHGLYFIKLYQYRSYVLALRGAADVRGMYVDAADAGMSFRNAEGLLLLGGGGHRTGRKGGGWRALRDFARLHYPQAEVVGQWAAQDCMTLDGAPYIG